MIIGLSGYAGTGKDTLGAFLATRGFKSLGFADPLRAAAIAIDPVVGIDSDGDPVHYTEALDTFGYNEMKFIYPEARRFLQRLGTEFGRRQVSDTFWVDQAMARIKPGENVVITDCRFANEATAIKARGGIIVRIERPGFGPVSEHPSETELDAWHFDQVIVNDVGLDGLEYRAALLVDPRPRVLPV